MNHKYDKIAEKIFRKKYEELTEREKKVARHLVDKYTYREMLFMTFLRK